MSTTHRLPRPRIALPRRLKQTLLVLMVLLILFLLLTFESSASAPFLYIGF